MGTQLVKLGDEPNGEEVGKSAIITSYDGKNEADRRDVFRALVRSDARLDDMVGQTISVVHVVQHWVALPDQSTGEVHDVLRTVLIDPEGKRYSTCSMPLAGMLQRMAVLGVVKFPASPPVKMAVVKVKKVKGEGAYLSLEPV